jgi:hypothetical protein
VSDAAGGQHHEPERLLATLLTRRGKILLTFVVFDQEVEHGGGERAADAKRARQGRRFHGRRKRT